MASLTPKQLRGGIDRRADLDRNGGITGPNGGGNIGCEAHVWSPEIANKVRMLRALGNSHETIAFACDLHSQTVQKYYGAELQLGALEANHRVGAAIFHTALGEQVPCLDCQETPGKDDKGKLCRTCHGTCHVWRLEPNTTAQIWWSKNRMNWTDQQKVELTGANGGPIITEQHNSESDVHQRLRLIRERQKQLGDGTKDAD
jgi:hypothetical protein